MEERLGLEDATGNRLEEALRYLEEGKALINKDPVQASEKLYKAAEEVVKVLAHHFNLEDVLKRVRSRGRWTVAEFEKAVEIISERIGEWFRRSWDAAWALHVWGFHEAKFDSQAVKVRVADIEKMVLEMQRIVRERK